MAALPFVEKQHCLPALLVVVRSGRFVMQIETRASGPVSAAGEDGDVSLYVSSTNTKRVLAYDGEIGAFERKFARRGGIEPEGIAFGPDGNLYVSSRSDEGLRYDGETGKFIDVFASSHGLVDPAGIAFGGRGKDLFVASGAHRRRPRQPDPPLRRRHRRLRGRCRSCQRGRARRPRSDGLPTGPAVCHQQS
jgi:hypothetical protein